MLLTAINKSDHFLGNTNAKVAVTVFEDYECEYCGKAFKELTALRRYYKEEIFIVYKNFPDTSTHPHALYAAKVVEACALQNKFIQAHDLIFNCQEYLDYGLGGILRVLQQKYSVSIDRLDLDLQKEDVIRKVNNDIESGKRYGIKNTPAILINGCKYTGPLKFDQMAKSIEEILSKEYPNKQNINQCFL